MYKVVLKSLLIFCIFSGVLNAKSGFIVSPDNKMLIMYKDTEINIYSKILKKNIHVLRIDDGNINFLLLN